MRLLVFIFCVLTILFLSSFKRNIDFNASHAALDTIDKDTLDIDTVSITKKFGPDEKYELRKKAYREIYMWGDNKKPISINPFGGIAVSINKLYSHFSKIGKNSRRLQRVFKNEYDIDRVEVLWKPLTVKLTGLKGDSLFYFQMYFLPAPGFLEKATYYEKVEYVVKSMRIYRDSSTVIHQRMKLPKYKDIK